MERIFGWRTIAAGTHGRRRPALPSNRFVNAPKDGEAIERQGYELRCWRGCWRGCRSRCWCRSGRWSRCRTGSGRRSWSRRRRWPRIRMAVRDRVAHISWSGVRVGVVCRRSQSFGQGRGWRSRHGRHKVSLNIDSSLRQHRHKWGIILREAALDVLVPFGLLRGIRAVLRVCIVTIGYRLRDNFCFGRV
jgi:hypothetical protein